MKYDISALGNALVDTQYKVSHDFLTSVGLEADSMTLATSEEQAPIINKLIEMGSESMSDCGGSATNSLVAAANYGSKCHHVCRVADDADGKKYLDSLRSAGVEHIGISSENTDMPTGKCLILVTPDAKRTMSSMLGVSAYLGASDINYEVVENSKIFYIEGYMVTSDDNFNAVISVLEHLKGKGTIKALSLSDAGIITKGSEGSVVIENGVKHLAEAEKIIPVDTNGAGDMFAGSFMHAYLEGNDITECAKFSKYASSKVVETFGPRLDSNGYAEVLNKLKKR